MSDNFAPSHPKVFERLRDATDREIASYSAEDPASISFGKPEMTAQLRADAEDRLREICARRGIVAPLPKTAEQVREDKFEADWTANLGERQRAMIADELKRVEALDPAMLASQIVDLRKDLGDVEYEALVADARAGHAGPLPDTALASKFVLQNLQAVGRYAAAHARARAAAGFASK